MAGPLEGYRVIELAEGIAGPYAAMELGDAGADVVKVERTQGDRARGWGSKARGDVGAGFHTINRSKRGIALDPDTEDGAAVLRRLIEAADIVIADEGWTAHAELQPDVLVRRNPNLIYANISEFGEEGPWAGRPPHAELAAQMASEATMSLGVVGEPPVRMATDAGSMYAGIYSVQAICAALYARDEAGGQRIDVSLFGTLVAMRSTLWVALSNPDEWWGFHLDSYVKPPDYGYRCKDGEVLLQMQRMSREQKDVLYQELNMEWVKDDPLFELLDSDTAGGSGRYSHVVHHLWDRALSEFTCEEVIEITRRNGANAFPKNNYPALFAHPQVEHIQLVTALDTPGVGAVEMMQPPWEFEDTPAAIQRPAPRLGEHTTEVLTEAGFSSSEISGLQSRGVLAGA